MPYFKRLPYAEMMREGQAASSGADTCAAGPATGALALANAVLAEELVAQAPRNGDPTPQRLAVRTPVSPGETGRMTVGFENDDSENPVTIRLSADDLVGRDGGRIPAGCVAFAPQTFTLAPGGARDVRIAIAVPSGVVPGTYTGPLTARGADGLRGDITVEVRPPAG